MSAEMEGRMGFANTAVDVILANGYTSPLSADRELEHFEGVSAIYGTLAATTLEAAAAEVESQGDLIAVLFWRLAQALGVARGRVVDNLYTQTPEQAAMVDEFIATGGLSSDMTTGVVNPREGSDQ